MRTNLARRVVWQSVAGVVGMAVLLGASGSLAAPDDAKTAEPAKTKAAETKPSDSKQPPAKPDPFVVPEGSPEQLLKYLATLGELEPPARDPESVTLFNKKAATAILLAADKILAAKPTERQAAEAVQWKLGALVLCDRMGDPGADAKRKALPAELEKLGWKRLARAVQAVLLGQELARVPEGDAKAFRDHFEKIKGHVSQGEIGRQEIGLMMETAMAAERFGAESAVLAYSDFAKILAANPNKDIASLGAKLQGAARRLTLVGKPMDVGGQTLDGKALDWPKYRGKVVLVSFWATWCGPCREEIKSIQENYAAFHDKGFDVVAVSIDKDREALVGYMKDNAPPWTVLFDQAARSEQADKTMATEYGVMQIPQLLLLGKDGNVVALGVRGPQLGTLLKGLLGEPNPAGKGKKSE